MTTLLLKAAYIQDSAKKILDLGTFASEVWDENTEELSESCIKTTHKAYELIVCFIRYVLCDGVVKNLSDEIVNDMYDSNFCSSSKVFKIFITGFIEGFVTKINLVITEIIELPKTLAELKIIAKDLKVPSYASFKSIVNLQNAIDLKLQ